MLTMMQVYCLVMMSLHVVAMTFGSSKEDRIGAFASFVAFLPFYGRIQGWW